jgi:hypothetical protein
MARTTALHKARTQDTEAGSPEKMDTIAQGSQREIQVMPGKFRDQ